MSETVKNEVIKNRIDFVYFIDVKNGNPNGDPDAGNMPRIDAETGHGIISDVCLKRKVRNYVQAKAYFEKNMGTGYDIFITEGAVLDSLVNSVHAENNEPAKNGQNNKGEEESEKVKNANKKLLKGQYTDDIKKKVKTSLCETYYDIRSFGQVIATTGKSDRVRGPIQFDFAESVDQIFPRPISITRMAVTKEKENTEEDDESSEKNNQTMGRKYIIPYGLYVCHGFISANLARQTGFSEKDLQLFFDALKNMFDVDRSAARGLMSAQKLIVFKHDSILGNAPANKLFDLVKIERNPDTNPDAVPRSFNDYKVTIDMDSVPSGVTVEKLI